MIVLFTDFGLEGPYVGQMKAAVLKRAPQTQILDLMHDAPAFDIAAASLLLPGIIEDFATESIFICVVDPGVGGLRKPIYLKADGRYFVGPDNGLFTEIVRQASALEAFEITWRPESLSRSFHGRDLFAPVAAMLSLGHDVEARPLDRQELTILDQANAPRIIYIDLYGNCWTSLRRNRLTKEQNLIANGHTIGGKDVFCDTAKGSCFWYVNSSGFVEIACNQGHAGKNLGLNVGDGVRFIR